MCLGPGITEYRIIVESLTYESFILLFFFQLMLSSGSRVRLNMEDWGLSLALYVSGLEYNNTRGLCGIFDHEPRNDFHDTAGVKVTGSDHNQILKEFIEIWR